MTIEETLREYLIECRVGLKEKRRLAKINKPNDIASQIIFGAKSKAFQQVLDKLCSIGEKSSNWKGEIMRDIEERASMLNRIKGAV